jgi:dihydroorotate dehydrogenase electron transfer subunit|tara:strand:+ start:866 stop:1687 length:822 start_codon:yes stop_codon:yes gene_type:complete
LEDRILTNKPRITTVKQLRNETNDILTLFVQDKRCSAASPGQFAMIWVPGIGEIPMSLSFMDGNNTCGFTVKSIGITTKALCNKKKNDTIGIRGPYGTGFTPKSGNCLLIGGGTGLSPLLPLTKILIEKGAVVTLLLAGKSRNAIPFLKDAQNMLSNSNHKIVVTTDDGSFGVKGVASDYVEVLLKERYDMIYACGPEAMLKKIFVSAEKKVIPIQISLERYIKCGFGLCGSCSIGRYLLCLDGPVFTSKQLREIANDFGISRRNINGERTPI